MDGHQLQKNDGRDECLGCGDLTQEEEEAYFAKILIASIIGAVICVITTAIASLPVCCGKMTNMPMIPVSAVLCVVAGICMAIPLIAGKLVTDSTIEEICDDCGCTSEDEQDLKDAIGALGVFLAYTVGGGFVVVILGGVTICLGCCMCCPCCGPLKTAKEAAAGGGPPATVQGQVIGSAAS
jgi:hypothetical protein